MVISGRKAKMKSTVMAYEFTITENPALSRVDAILKRL